jgi:hypothetical protein
MYDPSSNFSSLWEVSHVTRCTAGSLIVTHQRTRLHFTTCKLYAVLQLEGAHGGGAALTIDGCTTGLLATCGQKTDFKVFR